MFCLLFSKEMHSNCSIVSVVMTTEFSNGPRKLCLSPTTPQTHRHSLGKSGVTEKRHTHTFDPPAVKKTKTFFFWGTEKKSVSQSYDMITLPLAALAGTYVGENKGTRSTE